MSTPGKKAKTEKTEKMVKKHTHKNTHTHEHSHDHEHEHSHDHAHEHHHDHSHTHDPQEIKKIINRISKAAGHLESTKHMLEDGRDCADVLIQLAAIRAEINSAGKALLKEHLEHCIVEAVAENDQESVDKMNKAIDMFMK